MINKPNPRLKRRGLGLFICSKVGMSSKAVNHYLDIFEQTYVNYRRPM